MDGNALLILDENLEAVGTVRDHVRAILACGEVDVVKVDYSVAQNIDLNNFAVVILHYSVVMASRSFISRRLKEKIASFRGLKIAFIQDEYRWIDKTAEAIRDLDIHVVFSLCSPQIVRKVYRHPWCDNVRFEYTLTGFVSDDLCRRPTLAYEQRPLDVAYRARKVSSWIGFHTIQKWRIADLFMEDAGRYGLAVNISTRETDRLYGEAWIDLTASAKAVLGTESGASICDFSGRIQEQSEAYLARHPNTSFDELKERFFPDADGKIMMNVISPRCFEAAALRTLMIMYDGDYGGILEAGQHYVRLQQDHSNMEEIVHILKSPALAKPIIQSAYDEIALSGRWSHRQLTEHVSRVMREEIGRHAAPAGILLDKTALMSSARGAARVQKKIRWLLFKATVAGLYVIENWLPKRARSVVYRVARAMFRSLTSVLTKFMQIVVRFGE
jgi:hypothetical protein